MSKPLTIDELKALQVGDWVWVVSSSILATPDYFRIKNRAIMFCVSNDYKRICFDYSDYGTKWLAYKNKEAAEAKGEIVELPFKRQRDLDGTWEVVSIHPDGFVRVEHYLGELGANKRLAELKGEKL